MKTDVQRTSLDAYFTEIVPSINKRQKEILELFFENPTMDFTNAEISNELNLPINSVTPRVYELLGKDKRNLYLIKNPALIFSRIRTCKVTKRNVRAVQINPDFKGLE